MLEKKYEGNPEFERISAADKRVLSSAA